MAKVRYRGSRGLAARSRHEARIRHPRLFSCAACARSCRSQTASGAEKRTHHRRSGPFADQTYARNSPARRRSRREIDPVGDDGQLNPIGAGSGMRLVQSVDPAQTDNTSLTKIVRQNDDIQRAIVEDLVSLRLSTSQPSANRASAPEAARRIAAAFVAEKRWASFQTSEDATARIVAEVIDSMSTDDIQPRPVVALARSNREVHHVTRLLRKAMRERQLLVGEDVDVRAVTPMGVTVRLKIAVGIASGFWSATGSSASTTGHAPRSQALLPASMQLPRLGARRHRARG